MSKSSFLIVFALLLLASCSNEKAELETTQQLTSFVNPFIGTGGHGHTFPGATVPFGMMQLSPDTRLDGWDGCSGYHYSDEIVYGFSHTHLSGTGVSDYGDVLLKPCIGETHWTNGKDSNLVPADSYASSFSKASESAEPGYYRVDLDEDIQVELTTTERTGMHRYTFFDAQNAHVILDLTHRDKLLDANIEILGDTMVAGMRRSSAWAQDQHVYFVMEFDQPFARSSIKNELILPDSETQKEVAAKAVFHFDIADSAAVQVRIGISAVDKAGALKNLRAEARHWNFDDMRATAKQKWEKELSKIQVADDNRDSDKTVFYTALYHSMIAPNIYSDVDGRYRKTIPKDEEARSDQQPISLVQGDDHQYTVFSLWDTYRATHPLYTLIDQKRSNEFVRTFLRQYNDGGQLPVWELASTYTGCMIGYHAVPVITDAYVKGITDYDVQTAFKAMRQSAMRDELGLKPYREQGFLNTGDEPESVSKTLEYAYDDWCIAQFSKNIGKESAYQTFNYRAQFYKNLYNPKTGFLQGRRNGGWQGPFRPEEVNFNYTEANAWQYSLAVPHDVNGLIDLMGGVTAFTAHLDNLFTAPAATSGRDQADITGLIGQYAHGNEPSHHMAYLYAYAGQAWKTQELCSQILDSLYSNAPDGLSGNEDCGQMSAWYVLSAMGFYPVCPGSTQYVMGSPQFEKTTLQLENGKQFSILAPGADEHKYIQSVSLNGKAYSKSFIDHYDIMAGGELRFEMGSQPNKEFGAKPEDRPSQRVTEFPLTVCPSITAASRVFEDSLVVQISSPQTNAEIRYTIDGTFPSRKALRYDGPITITTSTKIRAMAILDGKSTVVNAEYVKIEGGRSITLHSEYANQYAAGGDRALIDMIKGGPEFTTGDWQGYREDLDFTVDLGRVQGIERIALGCNQNIKSWIWFPSKVEIYSAYKEEGPFKKVTTIINDEPDDRYGALTKEFEQSGLSLKARFIRVKATQYGECPAWHLGAGGKTWIFVDELTIE